MIERASVVKRRQVTEAYVAQIDRQAFCAAEDGRKRKSFDETTDRIFESIRKNLIEP